MGSTGLFVWSGRKYQFRLHETGQGKTILYKLAPSSDWIGSRLLHLNAEGKWWGPSGRKSTYEQFLKLSPLENAVLDALAQVSE